MHWQRWRKFGDPTKRLATPRIGPTRSYVKGNTGYIELTRRKWALVDAEDFDRINQSKWIYSPEGRNEYARRFLWKNRKTDRCIRMHNEVLNRTPDGMVVDHIDGNGLNNRKTNLRVVTHSQNLMNQRISTKNTSGFKGVSPYIGGRWRAVIQVDGKQKRLGYYTNKIDAAKAYNEAATLYFGELALLNRIP